MQAIVADSLKRAENVSLASARFLSAFTDEVAAIEGELQKMGAYPSRSAERPLPYYLLPYPPNHPLPECGLAMGHVGV